MPRRCWCATSRSSRRSSRTGSRSTMPSRRSELPRTGPLVRSESCCNREGVTLKTMDGRVAVVTGAASGIGLAITEAFLAADMRVFMADLDEEQLRTQEQRLRASGADVAAEPVDVSDAGAVEQLGAAVVQRFGRLHVAVNNAGIVRGGRSWELSLEDWHRVVDVNLWGVIHGIRAFVPRILETSQEGHVINTASMAAVIARPGIGAYTATKHAVLGLSDVLRAELADIGAPV